MDDDALLRHSRHVLLEEYGIDGQARVDVAHVLVIGAGGLGSPVCLYLAAAGVGRITLVDDDAVDLTNLQRQIAHTTSRVGQSKVASAAEAMRAINPSVSVVTHARRAEADLLSELVASADVVVDCSDNFRTRHAVNAVCVTHAKPLVAGAAIRFDGQLSVYDTRDASSPCYACVFPPDATFEETRCAVLGVFAPVVGAIGTLQAGEALKLAAGITPSMAGRLLMFDGRHTAFDSLRVARDPACPVCSHRPH
ncbi:HesA/MoeB/ThiF family protein [Variovorax guangxiensis]|uniref:Molybdopterin-synthase adenylyltransferase n=1 Tax=Variovorax guangxiensis TaxID=1775474 RepID=A0A502DVM8_9BURK|nr:molybdopterin-synthase adenylyltransferase MoeB [Variovorax guangxiensis]TPG24141.1 molybdopterin-synthase adenylyltransferase MoeB [Variovorax ginsengisoli]TPG28391.1 molybdopterin-synthase adenylyltransferase MoeB [Variovorax guangxiensis]